MKRVTIFLKATVLILVILVTSNVGLARVSHNGAEGAYEGGGDGSRTSYNSIGHYIVAGAGFYLAANADVQKILRMVELQDLNGLDHNEFSAVVDNAIKNMIDAIKTYNQLIALADSTPYNGTIIARLNEFDYNAFMLKHGLNGDILNTATAYLQKGDITGVFKYTYHEYINIVEMLMSMRFYITYGNLPALPAFWKLNEKFSRLSIFGSYVARIFASLQET
jgi:hypothetical protein